LSCSVYWFRRKSNFHVVEDISIDIDAKELNDILRTNGHIKVDEDDKIDELHFIKEDYDKHDDDEIKEEKDNSD